MFIVERLISILAPHDCLLCGSEGSLVCARCWMDGCPALPERCYLCRKASPNSAVCNSCRRKSKLKHVWVRTDYEGLAKDLIRVFKFERAQAADSIIAEYMHESLPYLENTVIVPIPTATSRFRYRGYDHTALVAKELSKLTKLPHVSALRRLNQTRQVGAKRAKREEQLVDSFRIVQPDLMKGSKVLLIDDVVTTGTTLNEVAKTLKKAGAKQIDAAVFAQTQ